MFTKSIDATPGLTDFQIEYVRTHMNVPITKTEKKSDVWAIFFFAVLLATTWGIWACVLRPETVSDVVANMTLFGVVVLIVGQIIAFFAIVVAVIVVGGSDAVLAGLKQAAKTASTPEEGQEFALRIDARKMMSNRNTFILYRPSWRKEVRVFFGRTLSLLFFIGMIAHGYIFAPLVMVFVTVSAICVLRLTRQRLIASVKTLTAERVAKLEAAYERAESERLTPDKPWNTATKRAITRVVEGANATIDVPSAPGPLKFRFEATDAGGNEIRDTIEADNEADAQQKIRQMGYFVTKIRRCGDTQ